MADRLDAVGEEGLLTLLQDKSKAECGQRRLLLIAYEEDDGAHLEFIAGIGAENIQDRIALLGARTTGELIEIGRKCRYGCCDTSRPRSATSNTMTRIS